MIRIDVSHICQNCRAPHPHWEIRVRQNGSAGRGTPWIHDFTNIENTCDDCGHLMVGSPIIVDGKLFDVKDVA